MSTKFYIQENFRERFYQLPKVFFTNPNYQKLSNDAKIAYAILRDRLELSIKNNWIDEENAIFFIYTNENLMSILNLGKNKVINVKKELEEVNLLEQKRQGLNKPNKLYLMKPIITEKDIYTIKNEETANETSNDREVYNSNFQRFAKQTSRSCSNKPQEVAQINSSDTDISDTDISDTDISDTDISDMNYMHDNYDTEVNNYNSHSNHSNNFHQKQFDIDSVKELELQEFPEYLKSYLLNFDLDDLKHIKNIILKAKKSFNNRVGQEGYHYMLEDIEAELVSVLKRLKGYMVRKNEKVEDMQSYLMRSIINEIEDYHSLNLRREAFNHF
ncbi:TPA: replication initiator protein A [Staphylococcus aureus]|nr:replication initiator protein A [Staphylococcus aureus]